jgi:hypothetical protein
MCTFPAGSFAFVRRLCSITLIVFRPFYSFCSGGFVYISPLSRPFVLFLSDGDTTRPLKIRCTLTMLRLALFDETFWLAWLG